MRDRPILFSGAMVRAIRSGTKLQTRRIAPIESFDIRDHDGGIISWAARFTKPMTKSKIIATHSGGRFTRDQASRIVAAQFCPYGQPGDRLWVRETWAHHRHAASANCVEDGPFVYAADGEYALRERLATKWTPAIHMFRWASRITLEVKGVRVERLQDISEADALAEGVYDGRACQCEDPLDMVRQCGACGGRLVDARGLFTTLWESINGPDSWAANPYVWVVEFQPIESGAQQ